MIYMTLEGEFLKYCFFKEDGIRLKSLAWQLQDPTQVSYTAIALSENMLIK